ncbi:MAG: hypothetical protein KF774_11845 [Planctomyces sp.]|nr:hypothetical protein [Planctomyces sp.]
MAAAAPDFRSTLRGAPAIAGTTLALAVVLAALGPPFLCAPPGPDPAMYDVQARTVLDGGVLYRDVVEPNLPGAVWIHLAVRRCAGWSSEALRAFDLAWFLATAVLAAAFVRGSGRGAAALRGLVVLALIGGYASLSEWCHCQRDVWLLPFALGALHLRVRAVESADRSEAMSTRARLRRISEGVLWGLAVWLKPHIILPAIAALAAGELAVRRSTSRSGPAQRLGRELAEMVSGGLLVGAIGSAWLIATGAWQPMWTMLREWNPEYLAASAARWTWPRFWTMQARMAPWSLIQIAAAATAFAKLRNVIALRGHADRAAASRNAVLAGAWLGWCVQAIFLQHLFDYVYVPGLVLGATLVASAQARSLSERLEARSLRIVAASLLVGVSLILNAGWVAAWPQCVREGSTPAVRDRLARLPVTNWSELSQVEAFLAAEMIRDGELTAYHTHTVHLLRQLDIRPSTRFVLTETHIRLFPSRTTEIKAALDASGQQYIVVNLLEAGYETAIPRTDRDPESWRDYCDAESMRRFPFHLPAALRAGRYVVLRATGAAAELETRFLPLAAKTAGL